MEEFRYFTQVKVEILPIKSMEVLNAGKCFTQLFIRLLYCIKQHFTIVCQIFKMYLIIFQHCTLSACNVQTFVLLFCTCIQLGLDVITITHIYTQQFYLFTLVTQSPWRKTEMVENLRATEAHNAVKYGETAGITCLTLQPVLALVSMNMTFSSLALCSPSSIVICLQENWARLSILTLKRLIYSILTRFIYCTRPH